MRAVEVKRIAQLEKLRARQIEKNIELPPEVWDAILELDRLENV